MAQFSFNSAEVEPDDSFDVIPAGSYNLEIEETEVKDTKAGNGSYLNVTFSVADGNYVGRKVWGRFTLSNPNQTAVQIGHKQLSGLCRAAGIVGQIDNSDVLHGRVVSAKVIVKNDAEYGDKNEIKSFKAIEGQQMPTGAAGSDKGPAWNRAAS